ncbi:MAG TPA: hypothetical protein ENI23_00810 [bacterium]|nr:hypothetical protein [bacterium]
MKHCNLEETKSIVLKVLSFLRKEVKNADELTFELNKEVFSLPNLEIGWLEHGYNGKMNFSISMYSKKNDERKKKNVINE